MPRQLGKPGQFGQINDLYIGWRVESRENMWLYQCWYDMFVRVYTNDKYANVTIEEDFYYLSKYIEYIKSLPRYEIAKEQDFKQWTIDKDISGMSHYGYNTICLMTQYEQNIERNERCGYPGKSLSKRVQGININDDSDIIYYNSTREAEKDGFDHSCIAKCCNGKIKSGIYKGYRWQYILLEILLYIF